MRSLRLLLAPAFLFALGSGCTAATGDPSPPEASIAPVAVLSTESPPAHRSVAFFPTREEATRGLHQGKGLTPANTRVPYTGGSVMDGTKKIYIVWYGNWTHTTVGTVDIVEDFARNVGGSPYFKINETYWDVTGHNVDNSAVFAKSAIRGYTKGKNLTQDDVANIVEDEIDSGNFPADPNAVYFVIGAKDVAQTVGTSKMCTSFCAWHSGETYESVDMKYVYLGSGDRCPSACEWGVATPNGNAEADALAGMLGRELGQTATDPDSNAWKGASGENGDVCAWTTGDTYAAANGAANVHLGTRDYLLHQNFVNVNAGACDVRLAVSIPTRGVGSKTGDFNGDGVGELLFRDSATGGVFMWFVSGGTTVVDKHFVGAASGDWELFGVGDMNGDKKPDITFRQTRTQQFSTWFMNGATKIGHQEWSLDDYGVHERYVSGFYSQNLSDNRYAGILRPVSYPGMDQFELFPESSEVDIWSGGGFSADNSWQIVGTGDFNHDGAGDILWQSTVDGTMSAWLMKGGAILGNSNMGSTAPPLAVADLDGDGTHDYVVRDGTNIVKKRIQNGYITQSATLFTASMAWRIDQAVDLNNDGREDLIWRNRQTGDISVWTMGAGGVVASHWILEAAVPHDMELVRY